MRRLFGAVLVIAAIICVTGCGAASTTSTAPRFSPAQEDNAQRVAAYHSALRQILVSFSKPPANPTDVDHGLRLVSTSIAKIKRLTPPKGFAKFQHDLIRASEAELPAGRRLAAALRSKDPVAINNAEAAATEATSRTRAVYAEGDAAEAKCRANNFTC